MRVSVCVMDGCSMMMVIGGWGGCMDRDGRDGWLTERPCGRPCRPGGVLPNAAVV